MISIGALKGAVASCKVRSNDVSKLPPTTSIQFFCGSDENLRICIGALQLKTAYHRTKPMDCNAISFTQVVDRIFTVFLISAS